MKMIFASLLLSALLVIILQDISSPDSLSVGSYEALTDEALSGEAQELLDRLEEEEYLRYLEEQRKILEKEKSYCWLDDFPAIKTNRCKI